MEEKGCDRKGEANTDGETPGTAREGAGMDWHTPSSYLSTSLQCLPRLRRTEASWHGDLGTRILQGRLSTLQAPAGWAVDSTNLPNASFLFSPSLPPSIPQPLRDGMTKQLDWVKRLAPALSASRPAAFPVRSKRLPVHTYFSVVSSFLLFLSHLLTFPQLSHTTWPLRNQDQCISFHLSSFLLASLFALDVWISAPLYSVYSFNRHFLGSLGCQNSEKQT